MLIAMSGWFFSSFFVPKVGFNDEIRPILNEHCLGCHGGVKQLGGLSFLFEEDAKAKLESDGYAIVPGRSHASLLVHRVKSTDPEIRMPPEGPGLDKTEIKLLERWIDQGAPWEVHWAYAQLPDLEYFEGNNIDYYINRSLDDRGIEISGKAPKTALLRRLSLDLIGLPPTVEEIESFCKDEAQDAYERQVDRLLDSPHFGERWAAMWMDLARYGDSQGYQKDPYRSIWRYRDWLIDAFNNNIPFDQFTIQQLAGDLLDQPTEDELLATAFHRNTMTNDEGGTDDEEFRVAAVLDRVNTTWEVWQGSSMSCVQCHSHPYDPFLHEDYYRLYAFFNNTKDADKRDDAPLLYTYGKADQDLILKISAHYGVSEPGMEGTPKMSEIRETLLQLPQITSEDLALLEGIKKVPTPIMEDFPPDSSRQSFLFERGNWLVHGAEMAPDVPGSMPKLESSKGPGRLDLAQWIVSRENPLTARVIVNRFWANLFGRGLVSTLEDFGTMGERPSHPQLIDWLATYFVDELDWNVKDLLKIMVMSEVYQRSSAATKAQLEKDPSNIYLSHMPRRRLTAEQIRDQALKVSGLLSQKMYGPSVMPPQPEGVWQVIRNVMKWKESEGEDRYRRALYTFWRKSSPYPSFVTFDSPSREICLSRRITTNTPLQALVTLNDTVYVEAARALAQSVMDEGEDLEATISSMYERALGRMPSEITAEILTRQYWNSDSLISAEGKTKLNNDSSTLLNPEALTTVANVIMNLDEYLVIE